MSKFLAAVLTILLLISGSELLAADWPMFRGSPARLGRSSESLEPPLSLAWQSSTSGRICSSPSVVGNIVYFGTMDGYVCAVNALTGAPKWRYFTGGTEPYNTGVLSSPCVDQGVVYAGARSGSIFALSADTGALVWQFSGMGQIFSSPVVSNGIVYCGTGWPVKALFAVRASDGQMLWKYPTLQYVHTSPAIYNNEVIFGANDGMLRALNAQSGNLVWEYNTKHMDDPENYPGGTFFMSTPAVENGRIYCLPGDYDSRIYCLDAATGTRVWEYRMPMGGYSWYRIVYVSSPAVAGGMVYAISGNPSQYLYAFDAQTGALRWSFATGPSSSPDLYSASPTVAGNTLYIGSWDGTLYALDATTGQRKWSYKLPSGIGSTCAAANGWLYVGCDDGSMYAFTNTTSGGPTMTLSTPSAYVKKGWNLISLPGAPKNPDPQSVFAGINMADASLQYWQNDVTGGGFRLYGALSGWMGPVRLGTPYWLLNTGSATSLSYEGTLTTTDQVIGIPAHGESPYWITFGHPMSHRTPCSAIRFSTPTDPTPVDWVTAYQKHWVESLAMGFEPGSSPYFTVGADTYQPDRNYLEPWKGYWLLVRSGIGLNIHIPVAPVAP